MSRKKVDDFENQQQVACDNVVGAQETTCDNVVGDDPVAEETTFYIKDKGIYKIITEQFYIVFRKGEFTTSDKEIINYLTSTRRGILSYQPSLDRN